MTNFWTNNPARNSGSLTTSDPTADQGGSSYYGILKMWTGSMWVNAKLRVFTGGTWQTKPVKRWDGAEWKLINSGG